MLVVEQRAELRRLHFVQGVSIKELSRRTGLHRSTIRRALRSDEPPRYERAPLPSKLDPLTGEIHRLLRDDPHLPGVRIRELLSEQGYAGRRRSSMRTCARSARSSSPRPAHTSAPRTAPESSRSSISGSRSARSRSASVRRVAGTSSSLRSGTRGSAPPRWCSRRNRPTSTGRWRAACGRSAGCRRRSSPTRRCALSWTARR